MEKLISVVVPIYNVEKYLDECIESIINQTYKNLEIILVNDGSTDSCGKICDEYEKKDNRIKVIHKKNGGLSDARNFGIDISTGDYISFIDSDDFISPYFFEIMMQAMESNNCEMGMLANSTSFYDGEEVELAKNQDDYASTSYDSIEALELMFYQQYATGAPFKICKKSVFDDIRFPVGYYYEDVATTYKEFSKVNKVVVVQGDLYAYRKRKDSITHQKFNEKKMCALDIYEQLISDEWIIENGLYNAALVRVYTMIVHVFFQIPYVDKQNMKKIWKKVSGARREILKNKSPYLKKKCKFVAFFSVFGMNMTHLVGKKLINLKK